MFILTYHQNLQVAIVTSVTKSAWNISQNIAKTIVWKISSQFWCRNGATVLIFPRHVRPLCFQFNVTWSLLFKKGNDSQRICDKRDFNCVVKIISAIRQKSSKEYKDSDCLPDCNSIIYNHEVMNERMTPEINDTILDVRYSASFFFGDNEFVAYKRLESYGTVGLLSNIGGLLGLFLGLSVLSVFETFYFFTLWFFIDLWHKIS